GAGGKAFAKGMRGKLPEVFTDADVHDLLNAMGEQSRAHLNNDVTPYMESAEPMDSSEPEDVEPTKTRDTTDMLDKPFPIKAGKLDTARYIAQDKFIDLQRIQEGIEQVSHELDDATNVKQGAELHTSQAAAQVEDFRKEVEKPLVK